MATRAIESHEYPFSTGLHSNQYGSGVRMNPLTRNSYAQASSSLSSAMSHSSGSSASASRSVDVRGRSLSMRRCNAERMNGGVKTGALMSNILENHGGPRTVRMIGRKDGQDILE